MSFSARDVEDAFLGGDEEIADEDGVAVHIVAAHVECPGDVVQRGEQDAVSPAGEELFRGWQPASRDRQRRHIQADGCSPVCRAGPGGRPTIS